MPTDSSAGKSIFLEALEAWEQPYPARQDEAVRESSPGRFLRGLDDWEWPTHRDGAQEIYPVREHQAPTIIETFVLKAKASVEVITDFTAEAWTGAPVFLERVGVGLVRTSRLDALGRLLFEQLPPGDYRMRASELSAFLGSYSSALLGAPGESDSKPVALDQKREFPDWGLLVSVRIEPQSEISVTFTATDRKLANATVRLAFSDRATGEIQLSGKVELKASPWRTGSWSGHWQYPAGDIGSSELSFIAEPQK